MEQLAIANVPMQKYQNLYTASEALARGTAFRELDLPWAPQEPQKGGIGLWNRR